MTVYHQKQKKTTFFKRSNITEDNFITTVMNYQRTFSFLQKSLTYRYCCVKISVKEVFGVIEKLLDEKQLPEFKEKKEMLDIMLKEVYGYLPKSLKAYPSAQKGMKKHFAAEVQL